MASEAGATVGPEHAGGAPPVPRVGIVGGQGQMGRWFARFLGEIGCPIAISDRETDLDNATLAGRSNIVIVCVPIRVTPAVLFDVVAAAPESTLVVSTASLMLPALPPLREARGEALCLHPLFGPTVASLHGQTVVTSTVRPGRWAPWLTEALARAGASVQEMVPQEHDRAMASVQAMQHACFVAFANALAASDLTLADALGVATPSFRLFLALAARILRQDARLYGDIVTLNPAAPTALGALESALQQVRAAATTGDAAAFERLFATASSYLGATDDGAALAAAADRALLALE